MLQAFLHFCLLNINQNDKNNNHKTHVINQNIKGTSHVIFTFYEEFVYNCTDHWVVVTALQQTFRSF